MKRARPTSKDRDDLIRRQQEEFARLRVALARTSRERDHLKRQNARLKQPETTVYAIQPGRGFGEAAAILGADYAGVLVRDGWAPYRHFTAAAHQSCLAHLLRRARDLARDHPRAPFAARVTITLQQALGIRDRRVAGVISPHGAAVARGHVLTHLFTALDHVGSGPRHAAIRRPSEHRAAGASSAFSSTPPSTPPIGAPEHALRPAVVNRKVCGGNRSARGAHTQQVLTSVLRTAQQRQLDASEVLVELLRAPQPTVSQTLAPPPEPSPRQPVTNMVPHTNVCTIQPQQVGRAVGRGCGCARAS